MFACHKAMLKSTTAQSYRRKVTKSLAEEDNCRKQKTATRRNTDMREILQKEIKEDRSCLKQ